MDPLRITASIIAVLQLAAVVEKYVREVSTASKEVKKLQAEIKSIRFVLSTLDIIDKSPSQNEEWASKLQQLKVPGGPLEQIQDALQEIQSKLGHPGKGIWIKNLKWPFNKAQTEKLFNVIDRQKSLLLVAMQSDLLNLTTSIEQTTLFCVDQLQQIKDGTEQLVTTKQDEEREKVLQWLSNIEVFDTYNRAIKKFQLGTGSWFLDLEFERWASSTKPLSLHGLIGCGKTVLCSKIIEKTMALCSDEPTKSLAFFYFDCNNPETRSANSFLRSIVAQFASKGDTLPKVVQELYSIHKKYSSQPRQPTEDELIQTGLALMNSYDHSYVIIDAIDECSEASDVLRILSRVCAQCPGSHILVTCRQGKPIEADLEADFNSKEISLENVTKDIRLHVRDSLANDPQLKVWPDAVAKDIEDKVAECASGMFRLAACQLVILRNCFTEVALRKALKTLPDDLNKMYHSILSEIPDYHRREAYASLRWLLFSKRQLYLEEVAEAAIATVELDSFYRLRSPRNVVDICSSLVLVAKDEFGARDELRLAHPSVREYLLSEHYKNQESLPSPIREVDVHVYITNVCLSYISLAKPTDVGKFPLLEYAAKFWDRHVKSAMSCGGLSDDVWDRILCSLCSKDWVRNWTFVYDPDNPGTETKLTRSLEDMPSPLYYASYLGFTEVVKKLLQRGTGEVNKSCGKCGNPLQAAASEGHEGIVKLLLDARADVNAKGGKYGSALQAASNWGHKGVVELLLAKGADVNAKGGNYGSALQAASNWGHKGVVELLLAKGTDVNAKGGDYGAALEAAANWGHEEVVALLLKEQLPIQPVALSNAMHSAVFWGHSAVVASLLSQRHEFYRCSDEIGDTLKMALHIGNQAVTEELVNFCKSVLTTEILLHTTVYFGNNELVLQLLEDRQNMDFTEDTQRKLLRAAIEGGSFDVFQRFQELGCTWSGLDSDGWDFESVRKQSDQVWLEGPVKGCDFGAEPNPLEPQSWMNGRKGLKIDINNGTEVDYKGIPTTKGGYVPLSIRADHPFPPRSQERLDYFEVEILECTQESNVCVGICAEILPLHSYLPGWAKFSWAYHGNDGRAFLEDGEGQAYDGPFGEGDIIGCGIDWGEEAIFFTRNGVRLGDIKRQRIFRRLYPMVGMDLGTSKIRADFKGPFKYNKENITGTVRKKLP